MTLRKLFVGLAALAVAGVLGAAPASAIPTFFTNQANFQAAAALAGITLGLEDFDSLPASGPTNNVALPSGDTVTSPGSNLLVANWRGCTNNCIQFNTPSSNKTVTFNFASPVNAFGIVVTDLGTVGATTLSLMTTGGSQVLFPNFQGNLSNLLFGGVIDTSMQFTSATFTNTDFGDIVGFDNMETGVVPEPGTLALIVSGLATLGFRRRAGKRG